MAEFWNVCTRPAAVNGLGLSVAATDRYGRRLERMFLVLPDSMETFREWRRLVVQRNVIGAKVHDIHPLRRYHGNSSRDRSLKTNGRFSGQTDVGPKNHRCNSQHYEEI